MAARQPTNIVRSSTLTLIVLMVAAMVIVGGLLVGAKPLPPEAAFKALFFPDGKIDSILVWTLRLPRSLAAFIAGAGLGVSGYLLQVLTRNPLAGPDLTGVTSGAVAPIVYCFVFFPSLSSVFYPLVGLAGGLAAAFVTFWISRGGRGRPLHLALGGISVSLFLGALTTYILLLSGSQAPSLLFWLTGGFQGRSWTQLAYMTPWVLVGAVGALAVQRVVGLLMLSEEAAAGMGLRLEIWKPLLLLLAVLPVAGVAPIAGPVAFVGLAAPHITRLLKPSGPGWTIVTTAALGGLILVAADVVARSVAVPKELPVSVITALIGGPVFIYLVQRRSISL
ncbi:MULTISPECIES: iron ABC transporter permease [unclassified Rhizobium]|uniref:FecCD family ABC transporter permease n=1 Tax=unclassified Rhizobium TaxID=2613769 RepID=UPI000EA97FFD|nr:MULTISPECIES: iron ABC transporter permease [unclassified Rhizobium]AYG70036.1 iron ABC transporter permease [Rhizobium sp. CCGE531]AYG76412.1 iron ABC transporter permease [Rhizobium sp. CCGE532]